MSLHYEFMLAFDLKPDTPTAVIALLQYLTRTEDYAYDGAPPPPIVDYWENDDLGWHQLLQDRGALGYVAGSGVSLFAVMPPWRQTTAATQYTMTIRTDTLDDDFDQLWFPMFMWLAQYSATEGWVGYYREAGHRDPTLLYFEQGRVNFNQFPNPLAEEPPG